MSETDAYWTAREISNDPSPRGAPAKVYEAACAYLDGLDDGAEQDDDDPQPWDRPD